MRKYKDYLWEKDHPEEKIEALEEQIADLEATNEALVEEAAARELLLAAYKDKYGLLEI